MTDNKYDHIAANDVIDYLWALLRAEGVMTEGDYIVAEYALPLVPIVPIQDEPEMANQLGGKPYLVYDYYTHPAHATEWWRRRDELIFSIYCNDVNKIFEIANLMQDKFQAMDESAQALNKYMGPSNIFTFHKIELLGFETYKPAVSEGGRTIGEATVCYEYVRDLPYQPTNLLVGDLMSPHG